VDTWAEKHLQRAANISTRFRRVAVSCAGYLLSIKIIPLDAALAAWGNLLSVVFQDLQTNFSQFLAVLLEARKNPKCVGDGVLTKSG